MRRERRAGDWIKKGKKEITWIEKKMERKDRRVETEEEIERRTREWRERKRLKEGRGEKKKKRSRLEKSGMRDE